MMPNWEVRLCGSGGQGLILAGVILAEAAVRDGKNAVQTQSYGPEARGGVSKAEILISDEEINFPKVTKADVLLAMTQEACDTYAGATRENGFLIVDTSNVEHLPEAKARVYGVPLSRLAREATGLEAVANAAALGYLVGLTGIVSLSALAKALVARVPKGTAKANCRALRAGYKAALH